MRWVEFSILASAPDPFADPDEKGSCRPLANTLANTEHFQHGDWSRPPAHGYGPTSSCASMAQGAEGTIYDDFQVAAKARRRRSSSYLCFTSARRREPVR